MLAPSFHCSGARQIEYVSEASPQLATAASMAKHSVVTTSKLYDLSRYLDAIQRLETKTSRIRNMDQS